MLITSQVRYASRTLHKAKSGYEYGFHDNPSEYCRMFANRDGWGTGPLAMVRDAYHCYDGMDVLILADYRRRYVPGGSFFSSVVTERRAAILGDDLSRDLLRAAFRACRQRWPFRVAWLERSEIRERGRNTSNSAQGAYRIGIRMTRLEYLNQQHANFIDWYKQSEEKSKFLVTINTLLAGVINGLLFVGADKVVQVKGLYNAAIWCFLILSGFAIVGSYVFILKATWARHHGQGAPLKDNEKYWFFGDVASMTREKHQELLGKWSEDNLDATMSAQNYILARNVKTKFDALNWAISLTVCGLILLFASGITYAIAVTTMPLHPTAVGIE